MPFTEANGKRFFFYKSEPVDGTQPRNLSVLAIHGLGSSHSFYLPVIPRLAAAGIISFMYDTYGSGLSILPSQQGQDIESMVQDALAIMEKLNLIAEHTILMGHSMGGIVACYLASKYLFAGVVLLGPVHPSPAAANVFAKRIEVVNRSGMESLADTIPRAATGSKSTPTQHAWIRSLLLSQQSTGYTSLCRVIVNATAPEYRMITSPILLIAGAQDNSAPLNNCRHILESCGTRHSLKKLAVLEGVGHWHCVEAPDKIAGLIVDFAAGM